MSQQSFDGMICGVIKEPLRNTEKYKFQSASHLLLKGRLKIDQGLNVRVA